MPLLAPVIQARWPDNCANEVGGCGVISIVPISIGLARELLSAPTVLSPSASGDSLPNVEASVPQPLAHQKFTEDSAKMNQTVIDFSGHMGII